MVKLGEVFPNFTAESSQGTIKFHEWIGDSWAILFSHPRDYTPVCTTELSRVLQLEPEFTKRKVKLCALSVDSVDDHKGWGKDVLEYANCAAKELPFPIIADHERKLAVDFGMLDPDERTAEGMPLTARAVFIIGPDKKLKLSILYPATTGRNFNEILRVVDSLQLTATQKVATPADWQPGEKCMVVPTLPKDEAYKMFPDMEIRSLPSGKEYLRFTPQPKN